MIRTILVIVCMILGGSAITKSRQKATDDSATQISGPYLGQRPPGDSGALFAPGIV